MVDLTPEEIESLLWHIETITHAYGHEHPDQGAAHQAELKLLEALR
jgi:hypothetical protein